MRILAAAFVLCLCQVACRARFFPENSGDTSYDHVKAMEGNPTTGVYDEYSGVLIGMNIHLINTTERELMEKGLNPAIVAQLRPYVGVTAKELAAQRKSARDLYLGDLELRQLNQAYLSASQAAAESYGHSMSHHGRAVLTALHYWAGSLKDRKTSKLTSRDRKQVNYVWQAIREENATDEELLKALEDTLDSFQPNDSSKDRLRLKREIKYLQGNIAVIVA